MQATCEVNYARFLQVLPDCDTQDLAFEFTIGTHLSYRITLTDTARYTTTLLVEQLNAHTPAYLKPSMEVRLYHDARMAEVISSQNTGAFAPSYAYPNRNMRQRNEKQLVNQFLGEWLQFCLNHQPSVTSKV
ncbi:DUF1249 domain-containing protein [Salinimonas marina]|uniref:DUF1249 domain-containing protein n=1 Tax=Salinimonas marina TaxID=2785918 RepID=A0A7S9E0D0_9ALTE|nr:DUF1249 domain-containing protein [Salinimonas marina]QPG07245.1 DUF1249 domain-containing protein [Salinimonas marina]